MRNILTTISLIAILALSGCGEDRSHPKNGNGGGSIDPKAIITLDKNQTQGYTESDDGDNNSSTLYLRWFNKDDKLVFDGSKSQGNIQTYTWSVKNEDNTTMSDNCISSDANGSKLVVKICDEANDPQEEKFSVRLEVKDDNNKTSTTQTKVRLY